MRYLILILLSCCFCCSGGLATTAPASSIITGASGFVGRHIVHQLLQQRRVNGDVVICLVRDSKVDYEQSYWDAHLIDMKESDRCLVKVLPYDMLDGGATLKNALLQAASLSSPSSKICVYHTASVFGPTDDPVKTANDNIKSAENVVEAMHEFVHERQTTSSEVRGHKARLILTSSMAAVRATNQTPLNRKYYTNKDWNTLSTLDPNNWSSCYQFSKAESERRAWELVAKYPNQLEMVSLCPSFIFGPPVPLPKLYQTTKLLRNPGENCSKSYSISLIQQWLSGESQVQSRLCVDVRDVAKAHLAAGQINLVCDSNDQKRYILSTEARLSSELTAEALKRAMKQHLLERGSSSGIDTSNVSCDTKFDGGVIKIGDQETECTERLKCDLGVSCRSANETFYDMVEAMLTGVNF